MTAGLPGQRWWSSFKLPPPAIVMIQGFQMCVCVCVKGFKRNNVSATAAVKFPEACGLLDLSALFDAGFEIAVSVELKDKHLTAHMI